MGEIADDMVEGRTCCLCGMFFLDPEKENTVYEHGYPAVCWDCWSELTWQQRKKHQKALVKTL